MNRLFLPAILSVFRKDLKDSRKRDPRSAIPKIALVNTQDFSNVVSVAIRWWS